MTVTQKVFTEVFTVIPDSKSKIKTSSYLESGKYAVVDQGKELVAGFTNTSPTVVENLLPVIVFGDHTRAVKYVDFPFTAGADGTQILKPSSLTNPKYGFYLVLHAAGQIPSKGYARHFSELKKMKFQLPSLEKQREIVEKLDSAFAEITSLEENLISRASVLELLLQGALSGPYKSAIDSNANSMRLGDIADFQGGSQPAKSNFLYKEQKGYVRLIQIRDFGSDKNLTYIPISSKNRLCTKSDILIGRYGASVGRILTGLEGAYNVALMKVIPKREIVDRDYLYFYLLSEIFQKNLLSVSDRSAQNGFSKDDISGFPVPIPSLREQKEIVAKLTKVRNEILEMKVVQLKTRTELTLLRTSLLSNALTQEEAVA